MAGRNCPGKCKSSIIIMIVVSIEFTLVYRMESKKSRSLISLPIYYQVSGLIFAAKMV